MSTSTQDASEIGIGAALFQEFKIIVYASKSVTHAENRYTNAEREMLEVVLGCLTFHHYLYGREFICNSNHNPLGKIHLKYLSDALLRLQSLLTKIQYYDVPIKYLPCAMVPVVN